MSRLTLRPLEAPSGADTVEAVAPGGEREGLASLRGADWDSAHFGISIGKVDAFSAVTEDAAEALARWVTERANAHRWRLAMTRLSAEELIAIGALEGVGFRYRETTLVPTADYADLSLPDPGPDIRAAVPTDRDRVSEIARLAFRTDHFHLDPGLDPALADDVYVRWVGGWFDASPDRILTVCERDGRVVGFMGAEVDRSDEARPVCDLVLMGVDPASQGRGAGRGVMVGALLAGRERGAVTARSRVTAANAPTMALHQHVGFTLTSPEVTMHCWYDRA